MGSQFRTQARREPWDATLWDPTAAQATNSPRNFGEVRRQDMGMEVRDALASYLDEAAQRRYAVPAPWPDVPALWPDVPAPCPTRAPAMRSSASPTLVS